MQYRSTRILFITACLLFSASGISAQDLFTANFIKVSAPAELQPLTVNSSFADSNTVVRSKHSPTKATIYSAVLPGLGQAYNRKYWKIPIIYAGLGTLGYFIGENAKQTRLRQETLNARLSNDSNNVAFNRYPTTSTSILKSDRNYYRKYRDYSIIGAVLLYAINIVDAAVDAHLYDFNIDKPLSRRKEKHWHLYTSNVGYTPTYGLSFSF